MNLIEKLGGYEKAQAELDKYTKHGYIRAVGTFDYVSSIKDSLLTYRREHGIFEVGDKVFYTCRANDNDLYTLKETYDGHNFVVGSNGADKDFWTLFIDEIRHATPEEIAVGHRIESSNDQAISDCCSSNFDKNESQSVLSIKQGEQP